MRTQFGVIAVIFILLMLVMASSAVAGPNHDNFSAVDNHIEQFMQKYRIPGVALAIVEGDQVVSAGYQAADPVEYFVFIEGLVNLNREDEAIALTEVKIEQKSALHHSICNSIVSAPEYPWEFG